MHGPEPHRVGALMDIFFPLLVLAAVPLREGYVSLNSRVADRDEVATRAYVALRTVRMCYFRQPEPGGITVRLSVESATALAAVAPGLAGNWEEFTEVLTTALEIEREQPDEAPRTRDADTPTVREDRARLSALHG